jgi:hypothetical protein
MFPNQKLKSTFDNQEIQESDHPIFNDNNSSEIAIENAMSVIAMADASDIENPKIPD